MSETYTRTAKTLHWLTAVLVITLFGLGWTMVPLPLSPEKLQLYGWHKWIGVTVFTLTALRLLWRLRHPPPPMPADMPAMLKAGAHGAHWALYGLLFVQPVIGWLMSSASGFKVVVFGILPLPDLVAADKVLADQLKIAHEWGSRLLLILLLAHVGAALWHHIVRRDDVLRRMLPGRSAGRTAAAVLLGAGLAAAPFAAAEATTWIVDREQSAITFTTKVLGSPFSGRFEQWTAQLVFDPNDPEAGRVRAEIATGSASTGNSDVNAQLPTNDWFAVDPFPAAVFEADGFRPDGEGRYLLQGKLTVRGETVPVELPVTIELDNPDQAQTAVASGEIELKRLDFGIGQGQWSATTTIANEVTIEVRVVATRAR